MIAIQDKTEKMSVQDHVLRDVQRKEDLYTSRKTIQGFSLEWTEFFYSGNREPIPDLIEIIAEEFHVDPALVMVKGRKKELKNARFYYMFLLHKILGFTTKYIERITGWDHASVMWASKTVENYLDTEKKYFERHFEILKVLNNSMVKVPIDPKFYDKGSILIYNLHTIISSVLV